MQLGAVLALPGVLSYSNPLPFSNTQLIASGAGGTLSFANLATIGPVSSALGIRGINQGQVLLPALTTIIGDNVTLEADGTNATVSVPSLVRQPGNRQSDYH